MDLCTQAGFDIEDILYANTMKAGEDLQGAADRNIQCTTTDSVEGIHQIASTSWRPRIIVRIAVDDSQSRSPFSIKFGATEDEWLPIMRAIRQYNIPFDGVSFHVGSASSSPKAFANAIELCRKFQKAVDAPLPTVDIGGGFLPNAETFAETTGLIRKAMLDWSRSGQVAPSRWIAEPGRFFSAPTQTLLVPIVFKKSGKDRVRYLLDDSVYGQFSSIVYDHARPFWKVVKNGSASAVTTGTPVVNTADSKKAFFFGKTCDSLDLIAIQDKAPDYDIGDVFAFPWMGAYTSASATSFNGFALPSKTYINDTTSPINPLFNEIVPQKGEDNKLWLQRNEVNQEDVIFPIETRSKISLSVCNSSNSDE